VVRTALSGSGRAVPKGCDYRNNNSEVTRSDDGVLLPIISIRTPPLGFRGLAQRNAIRAHLSLRKGVNAA
jgi:hypothetical protein